MARKTREDLSDRVAAEFLQKITENIKKLGLDKKIRTLGLSLKT